MAERLTEEDGRTALREHVAEKAMDARLRHGLLIDADQMVRVLDDRTVVRYPVGIRFDAEPLEPGEFAWPMPLGDSPSKGFCLFIHPYFEDQPEAWPLLIAYHIPSMNYGEIATHEEAEIFGATLLGLEQDEYYNALCELTDSMPTDEDSVARDTTSS
jgi:hypothetical protein